MIRKNIKAKLQSRKLPGLRLCFSQLRSKKRQMTSGNEGIKNLRKFVNNRKEPII